MRYMNNTEQGLVDVFNVSKKILLYADNVFYNGTYGVAGELLEYAGECAKETCLTCPIEHGLTITNKFVTAAEHLNNSKYIITNSVFNEQKINRISDKKVIKIGPYIAYAKGTIIGEEMAMLKKKYGKTLLIIPTHGIKGYENRFDMEGFIREIHNVAVGFDTVIVCMYYYDILRKQHIPYKNAGFKIVSAGNSASSFFMSRLRSILELSDAVMSNEYTTGLQYAIYLDKPVYIYKTQLIWKNTSHNNVDKFDSEMRCMENWYKLQELCDDPNFGRIKEQKEWGKYMFGIDLVMNNNELKVKLQPVIRRLTRNG